MSQANQIPFGLREGVLVSVSEVERGLACGATCPHCHGRLIARKGERRVAYFAHHSAICASGPETSLHLMAKRIIAERKTLVLPPAGSTHEIWGDTTLWHPDDEPDDPFYSEPFVIPQRRALFSSVDVERQIAKDSITVVPDLIATDANTGETVLLECLVTHEVDGYKQSKIEEFDLSCVEVNLREFFKLWRKGEIPLENFPNWLIEDVENKKWIYCRALEARLEERRKAMQLTREQILSDLEHSRRGFFAIPYEEAVWTEKTSEWRVVNATVDPARPKADGRFMRVTWRVDLPNTRFEDKEIVKWNGGRWDPQNRTWYYLSEGSVVRRNCRYSFASVPWRLQKFAKGGKWTRLPIEGPPPSLT